MPERKVYISSTFIDYADVRQKFMDLLNKDLYKWYSLNWIMEHMRSNGDNTSPVQLCMDEVKRSDIYILIIGDRYGSETTVNGKLQSYTEHEFDAAVEANIATLFLIFAGDDFESPYRDADPLKRQKLIAFRQRAQQKMLKARRINSVNDVYDEFMSALYIDFHKRLIKEKIDLSPTIKYTINRNLQDELYLKFNNPQQRVKRSVVPTFIFTKTEDKPDYYSQKIWLTKLQKEKLYNKHKIVNQYNSLDVQKNLDNLIYDTTDYFLSEKDENIWTFDEIVKDKKFVDGQKIIEFEVAAGETAAQRAAWIKLITAYINQMQEKFYANDRRDKIYVIIVVLYEEKITGDEMQHVISEFSFMEAADETIPKIEVMNLQKLERINIFALKEWVESNFNEFPSEKDIIITQLNQYDPETTYTYQQVIEEFKFKI